MQYLSSTPLHGSAAAGKCIGAYLLVCSQARGLRRVRRQPRRGVSFNRQHGSLPCGVQPRPHSAGLARPQALAGFWRNADVALPYCLCTYAMVFSCQGAVYQLGSECQGAIYFMRWIMYFRPRRGQNSHLPPPSIRRMEKRSSFLYRSAHCRHRQRSLPGVWE